MISGEIKIDWIFWRNGKDFDRKSLKLGELEQQYKTGNVCSEQLQRQRDKIGPPDWKG